MLALVGADVVDGGTGCEVLAWESDLQIDISCAGPLVQGLDAGNPGDSEYE